MVAVQEAPSADALLSQARRIIPFSCPLERSRVGSLVARHGRHWNGELVGLMACRSLSPELARNPTLSPDLVLMLAKSCVERIGPGTGFITGMANDYRQRTLRALIVTHRLSATSAPGQELFAIALERTPQAGRRTRGTPRCCPSARARVALPWLLEFRDLPIDWLRALRDAYRGDAWTAACIDRRLNDPGRGGLPT